MTDAAPRVVLLSLDAFNHHLVSPELTPRLWQLAANGGRAPDGGRCDVPSVTYVSHATLITGTYPATHGLTSNLAATPQPGTVPGWAGEAQVRTPTLFAALRDAGIASAAVCGDQHLVRIMGAAAAGRVWPKGGILPEGTPVCPAGYALNAAIREPLLAAVADQDLRFVFGHLNETDTWGHIYGPDHARTLQSYAETDALVGAVIDALRPDWERVVLIVISDHGMEPWRGDGAIDLLASEARRSTIADAVVDGGAAIVRLRENVGAAAAGETLLGMPGVAAWREIRPGVLLVEARPGARFGSEPAKALRGGHGGPGATVTLAIAGGGHPAVRRIAGTIRQRPPHLADWAPTIAALLGVSLPTGEGRNLAA